MIKESSEQEKLKKLKKQYRDTSERIIETLKERKRVEKEYLDIIKTQTEYWKNQLKNVDPLKNKERYNMIKGRIKLEKSLIMQIKNEINRIDEELRSEKRRKNDNY